MVSFPHCKINLGLNVVRKRTDGYHDIVTCFYPVPVTEVLEVVPSPAFAFTCSGDTIPGEDEGNLCVKAFRLMERKYNIPPVKMHLHKVIPSGAGLGGGSSDAAFSLKMLARISGLTLSTDELAAEAATLGSDCAFFLHTEPMIGTGRGDRLTRVNFKLKGKFFCLVKPPVSIPTAAAYAGVVASGAEPDLATLLETQPVERWKEFLINDFEGPVFTKYPEVERIKQRLYDLGAVYSSMSGSGSAVYGIFAAPVGLRDKFPGMYFADGTFEW
ncbi:MAG TPA: 4-(cytidine 5'-diphospho)-2-C-methyl-D-erythritol kinase [Chryseosolibacter sp.]|nr:4-(cytidine 5'-diphospho)-2-C-methyl-D-erythritol kinase [Chryseosolibacter sp.]